jgi:hypothetical protein
MRLMNRDEMIDYERGAIVICLVVRVVEAK